MRLFPNSHALVGVRKPSPLSAYGAGQKVGGETPTRAHSCGWPLAVRGTAPKSQRQPRLSRRQVGSVLAHWPVSLAASLAWHFKTGLPQRPFLWDGERRRERESM